MTQTTNSRDTINLKFILSLGATLPTILVVVLGALVFNQFVATNDRTQWVNHTNAVLLAARHIEKQMVDLETGQRGFIITGKENFLEPFHAAKSRIFERIDALKHTVSDNPPQVTRLDRLEDQIQGWFRTAGNPEIKARRAFDRGEINFQEVADMLASETGKQQVDAVRATLAEFIAIEEILATERADQALRADQLARILLVFGVILIVIFTAATGWYNARRILGDDWVKSNQVALLDRLQTAESLQDLSERLLAELVEVTSAQAGTIYEYDQAQSCAKRLAGYGSMTSDAATDGFTEAQGLIGRCFASGKEIYLTDVPAGYFDIGSGFGRSAPKTVFLIPIIHQGIVEFVIELAAFTNFTANETNFLRSLARTLAVMTNNIRAKTTTENLLAEIQTRDKRSAGIINGSVDTIVTIDHKGVVQSFNAAGERLFGYAASDVIGQNVRMLMPAPFRGEHDGYLTNYRSTGNKKIISIGREVAAMRKDGTVFPIDLSVAEIDLGNEKLYSGIIRDITERKHAEEALQQLNDELEEFAYRTSHDLRSPIVSAVRLLDVARSSLNAGKSEIANQSLEHAHNSLKKLSSLINDILVLTEIKNKEELEQTIEMDKLVDDALDKMAHMKGYEKIEVTTDLQYTAPLIVKRSRLNMILENLISNAIKYRDPEKPNGYIKISTFDDGEAFVLEVRDNGLGVPTDRQDELFKMFRRFHPKTSFGSGLGLYLMKKSADILGGDITFQDNGHTHDVSGGSTFRLRLPQHRKAA